MLHDGNQSLIGYFFGSELARGSRAHAVVSRMLDDVAHRALTVTIDRRFPLSEAADAHGYIESRHGFGRIVLKT